MLTADPPRDTMPPYQLLPPLTDEEHAALAEDIARRGVLVPVEKDEAGNILDGHNRAEIARGLGIDYPVLVRHFVTEAEKREHVIKLNLARRHLDPVRWGQAFRLLLAEREVYTARGPKPDGANSATVAELAAEVGVPERTARHRLAKADLFDALPEPVKEEVRRGEKTLRQATKQEKPPPPFSIILETNRLNDWLLGRRESWPAHLRGDFVRVVRNLLDNWASLEDLRDDEGGGRTGSADAGNGSDQPA